jgi:hypothetical protein
MRGRGGLGGGVLVLEIRVVWIGPRLVLRWGRGIIGLARVGCLWEIGMRRVGGIRKIVRVGRVVLLVGWVGILAWGVTGWCWIVLGS